MLTSTSLLQQVATDTLNMCAIHDKGKVVPIRDPYGETLEHAYWMLEEIKRGEVTGEKGHRWLGYAQGLIVVEGVLYLEDITKICSIFKGEVK